MVRRAVSVSYTLNVVSQAAASAAVSTLSVYMKSTGFAADLVASGTSGMALAPHCLGMVKGRDLKLISTLVGLSSVTSTTVTGATTTDTSVTANADANNDDRSIIIIACAVVGTVMLAAIFALVWYCNNNRDSQESDVEAASEGTVKGKTDISMKLDPMDAQLPLSSGVIVVVSSKSTPTEYEDNTLQKGQI